MRVAWINCAAVLLGVMPALAADSTTPRKDAAEQAQEGDISHWIEYYRATRSKPDEKAAPASADKKEPDRGADQKPVSSK
jgi:hypothetical protein